MHGAAGLMLHRLGHEGAVDAVVERHLADDPLEDQHLVGEGQRVAMDEVHLELGRAGLVDQRIDVEECNLRVLVDRVDKVLVFRDRLETVGLG